jgi:hypothetical protein
MASGEELSSRSICSKVPVHSLEALELVICHHEGLSSLQSLGLGTKFLCLFFAEKLVTQQKAVFILILWLLL